MAISVSVLLERGDALAIEYGRLVIQPASGKPVPDDWLAEHSPDLVAEIVRAMGLDAFAFVEHSVGKYQVQGKHGPLKGGVSLQFESVTTRKDAYVIFNVDLDRVRDTKGGKAGTPLPKGQFYAKKRSAFVKFWRSTGLPMPNRLGNFHKRIGKLTGILFTGDLRGERFDAQTIRPLEVTAEQIKKAFLARDSKETIRGQVRDREGTKRVQARDRMGTTSGDKETPQTQTEQGLRPFSTAGDFKHGTRYEARGERYTVHGGTPIPSLPEGIETDGVQLPPKIQSDAEWWEDYDRAIHGQHNSPPA